VDVDVGRVEGSGCGCGVRVRRPGRDRARSPHPHPPPPPAPRATSTSKPSPPSPAPAPAPAPAARPDVSFFVVTDCGRDVRWKTAARVRQADAGPDGLRSGPEGAARPHTDTSDTTPSPWASFHPSWWAKPMATSGASAREVPAAAMRARVDVQRDVRLARPPCAGALRVGRRRIGGLRATVAPRAPRTWPVRRRSRQLEPP